jgi:hypothetical protein
VCCVLTKEELIKILNGLNIQEVADISRYCRSRLEYETKDTSIYRDLDFGYYVKIFTNRSSQSYGPRLEGWIKNYLSEISDSVSSKTDSGDIKLKNSKKFLEIKVSSLDAKGNFNIVQVRPHQKLYYYIIVIIKPKLFVDKYDYEIFLIPKKELEDFIIENGGLAHGTKISTENNQNLEYRMTIKYEKYYDFFKNFNIDSFETLKNMLIMIDCENYKEGTNEKGILEPI